MQEYGDQHQPEPGLSSAEELREQVALGEMAAPGVAAAPAGSLGHLMLVSAQLIPCYTPRTQDWSVAHKPWDPHQVLANQAGVGTCWCSCPSLLSLTLQHYKHHTVVDV